MEIASQSGVDAGEPCRIAFCITDLDPGGAERAMVQLVTRLDRRRWELAVFCLSGGGILVEELRAAGVRVVCLGARHWTAFGVLWRLVRELRRFRPQIVQTFLFHANLAGRLAARLAGVRHVVSGIRVAERRSRVPLWLDRWTNRLVGLNVCVSQAVAEFSVSVAGLPADKMGVIPNGVDVAKFENAPPAELASLGIPAGSRVLLTIGRLDPQKGLRDLIAAAAVVAPKFPDVHFLFVGEGLEREELERLIGERQLAGQVHLAGWRGDVPNVLAAGYALVLASLWEGMPNVVLEAMAAGLPVVATRVEGVSELVIDGNTGLVVPPHAPADLALAIEKVLADATAARAMGQTGREHARAEFSWERMASRYEDLYRGLVETGE